MTQEMALEIALGIATETVGEKRVKKRENENESVTKTERKRKCPLPKHLRENECAISYVDVTYKAHVTIVIVQQERESNGDAKESKRHKTDSDTTGDKVNFLDMRY